MPRNSSSGRGARQLCAWRAHVAHGDDGHAAALALRVTLTATMRRVRTDVRKMIAVRRWALA
jgi:hypothetical protein